MPSKSIEIVFKASGNVEEQLKRQGLTADQTARKMKELDTAKQSSGGRKQVIDSGDDEGEGGLKGIAESLGSRRTLRHILEGGVAGLVGSEVARFTGEIAKVGEEFRKGTIDASGMIVKIGEGLPILGGFVTAGQNIRDIFLHEKSDIEEINRGTEAQNRLIEYRQGILEGEKKRLHEIGEILHSQEERRARSGLEGLDLKQHDEEAAAADRARALADKKKVAIDAANEKANKQIAEIEKQKLETTAYTPKQNDAAHRYLPFLSSVTDYASGKDYDRATRATARFSADEQAIRRAHAQELADIEAQYRTVSVGEAKTGNKEQTDADAKAARESGKIIQDNEERIGEIRARARADQLRAMGRDGDAELIEIQRQADAKKAAIEKATKEQQKAAIPADRGRIAQQGRDEQAAVDAEAAQKRKEAQQKHQLEIDKTLKTQREKNLQDQVATAKGFSNKLDASRELETQKIKDEFQDRAKEVGKILNDPFATVKEKQAAKNQLQEFAKNSGKTFDTETDAKAAQSTALSSLSSGNTLSGVAEISRDTLRDNADAAKETAHNSKEGVAVQKQLLDAFKQFMAQWQGGGNTQNFVVGAGIQ